MSRNPRRASRAARRAEIILLRLEKWATQAEWRRCLGEARRDPHMDSDLRELILTIRRWGDPVRGARGPR